jgi:tetratricopeptide (TPR) repeat protein
MSFRTRLSRIALTVIGLGVAVGLGRPCVPLLAQDKARTPAPPKGAENDPKNPPKPVFDRSPPPDDARGDGQAPAPRDFAYSTQQAIGLFEERVKRTPNDFTSYTLLGDLYASRAREAGALDDYARAEAALRRAVAIAPKFPRARAALAAVLCDRHQFQEALALAQTISRENPRNVDALATMGDALLELGHYAEAEACFRDLSRRAPGPPALARLARLAELKGQTEEALRLLRLAAAQERSTGTAESASWYDWRIAEIQRDQGRLDQAEAVYGAILQRIPDHHDATFGLGAVCAAQGRNDEARDLLEKAVGIAAEPAMLAALGDLYTRTGHHAKASATYARLEQVAQAHSEYRRELAMFYADHNRNLPAALELARIDLAARPDIYGQDTLAWAAFKNGRLDEAARASAEAMKLGTRDARLWLHAGLIHARLGDHAKARDELRRALAINPHAAPQLITEARSVLDAIESSKTQPGP